MNYEPVTEGVDPPSLGGGAAGELLEVVPLWRRVSPQEGAVGEGLGDLLGDPVVGQDHALGHRLVDLEVLLRLDVLHVRRLGRNSMYSKMAQNLHNIVHEPQI